MSGEYASFKGNEGKALDLDRWGPGHLKSLGKGQLLRAAEEMAAVMALDRKEFALDYYQPASEDVERVHLSSARVRFVGGGNGSSKTESSLVECVMMATGIIPSYFKDKFPGHDWKKKLRGPVSGRIVCQSITNTLQPIILPKLRWNCWTGTDEPGGERGHWGWIPKMCLIDGEWQKSWSEKNRLLRLLYRNPDNIDEVIGESRIQFQSYDVDAADQESGDLHFVLLDEPPTEAIYNANEARTMRVGGWIMLAMTWPDDPAIAVDWIFDRIYDRGIEGPNKWPDYECFRLRTMKNQFINQANVAKQRDAWDAQKRNSRLEGMPIRFSNRVHELFTDSPDEWCFACGERQPIDNGHCTQCGSTDVVTYSHVADFEIGRGWPVIWVLDPHPRKPHMSAYFAVTPADDWWMVAELECKGDPTDLRIACDEMESALDLRVVRRLMDPRMGAHPSGTQRDRTWQDEFDAAGLYCEPADNSDTGRAILDHYLRPDPHTKRPRALHHRRCVNATHQMKRFMWDDWRQGQDKSQKQRVKEKYDDYPACWRYMANTQATYENLTNGGRIIRAGGVRRVPISSARERFSDMWR
jgi:hypothetical protein